MNELNGKAIVLFNICVFGLAYLVYCAIKLRQVGFEQRISFMKTKMLIK